MSMLHAIQRKAASHARDVRRIAKRSLAASLAKSHSSTQLSTVSRLHARGSRMSKKLNVNTRTVSQARLSARNSSQSKRVKLMHVPRHPLKLPVLHPTEPPTYNNNDVTTDDEELSSLYSYGGDTLHFSEPPTYNDTHDEEPCDYWDHVQWNVFPKDLGFIMFGFLTIEEVTKLARVSKHWQHMVGAPGSFRHMTVDCKGLSSYCFNSLVRFPGRASVQHVQKLIFVPHDHAKLEWCLQIEQVEELHLHSPVLYSFDERVLPWLSGLLDTCKRLAILSTCEPEQYNIADIILAKAKAGNRVLQNALGTFYLEFQKGPYGSCALQEAAVHWYRVAAEGGHAEAMFHYAHVVKTTKDYEFWLRKAALAGHDRAETVLALFLHKRGRYQEAFPHILHQATRGDRECQLYTGRYYDSEGYEKKIGVWLPPNFFKAVVWYTRASDRGCVHAMFNMSLMHEYGQGVEKDLAKSMHYLMKAANQGDYPSTVRLGDMYMSGKLGFIDCVAAQAWYKRATECPNIEDAAAFMALAKLHKKDFPNRDKYFLYIHKAVEQKKLMRETGSFYNNLKRSVAKHTTS